MTTDQTPATAPATEETFGIADLVFTLQVYEACAQRGAFKAEEMTNVGKIYDRLKAFLIANGAITVPAAPQATEEGSN